MSRLILMRHGQASFGAEKYDALSETGQAQARATGEWFRSQAYTPTALLHGPRQRQTVTALKVAEQAAWMLPAQQAAALDEFAEGEDIFKAAQAWLGVSMQLGEHNRREVLGHYDRTCRAWAEGAVCIEGRADLDAFRAGVHAWLQVQTHDFHASGQELFAVTSAGVIAAVACNVMGLGNPAWYELLRVVRNASLTEVLFSKGSCSLLSFNSVAHLPIALNSSM